VRAAGRNSVWEDKLLGAELLTGLRSGVRTILAWIANQLASLSLKTLTSWRGFDRGSRCAPPKLSSSPPHARLMAPRPVAAARGVSSAERHLVAALRAAPSSASGVGDLYLDFGGPSRSATLDLLSSFTTSAWHGFDGCGDPENTKDASREKSWPKASWSSRPSAGRVQWHTGPCNETVEQFLDGVIEPGAATARAAFVHFDADAHSSVFDVLSALASRRLLRAGCVLAFDER
jgi:hypothetical protein